MYKIFVITFTYIYKSVILKRLIFVRAIPLKTFVHRSRKTAYTFLLLYILPHNLLRGVGFEPTNSKRIGFEPIAFDLASHERLRAYPTVK